MTRLEVVLLFAAMTAVTYIPRALPFVLVGRMRFGPRTEKFLKLIPYTAMAALIFPGVISTDPDHLVVGIAAAGVAAVLGWKKCPVMVCVLGAIAADLLLYLCWVPIPAA